MNKYLRAIAATSIFVVLLLTIYALHVRYFEVNVVFYSSLQDVGIAAALSCVLLFLLKPFGVFNTFEKLQLLAIWLLGGYAFAISIPTVIDRSLSFYVLEKLEQRGGGIRQEAFERLFTREYVREHRLVDVRLTEQLQSGTIAIAEGCVKLTEKGKTIADFSRFYRLHFLPKKRLIMTSYTDDLTDPFRHSDISPDYLCN